MNNDIEPNVDAALFGALEQLGDEPWPGEADDNAILEGAFAHLDAGTPSLQAEPKETRHGRAAVVVAITAAVGLMAAAALLFFVLRPGILLESGETPTHSLAESVAEIANEAREATARDVEGRRNPTRAVVPPKPPVVPEPTITPDPEPDPEGDTDGEPEETTGDTPRVRRPSKAKTADELLRRAQAQLADGKRKAALASYQQLVSRFSKSAEAKAALVSMGRIELRAGRAKQALKHFDTYLAAGSKTLREEARYGRIRALRKLGRKAQEKASIESFLADHPKSLYASRLRQRLTEIDEAP